MNVFVGFGLAAYFSALVCFVYYLLPSVRKKEKLKMGGVKSGENFYEKNLHYFVVARQAMMFFLPFALAETVATIFYDSSAISSQLTTLFVLGLAINVFWVTQLPSLTKANILVTFTSKPIDENPDNDEDINEVYEENLKIKSDRINKVVCAVYNLGFSAYKNAMIIIYLGKEFEIFPLNDPKYGERLKRLDFSKSFTVQKKHGGAAFTPNHNFLTIPSKEVFLFPMFVRLAENVPKNKKNILDSILFRK